MECQENENIRFRIEETTFRSSTFKSILFDKKPLLEIEFLGNFLYWNSNLIFFYVILLIRNCLFA